MAIPIEELRPSLIIGLGGTGKIVLTHLRAYLEKLYRDVPSQRIRLLELDIDPKEEVASVDGKETKLREDELINLGGVPLEGIRREFIQGGYGALHSWFDPDIAVGERTLYKAAHQVRQAGRLAFHWHLTRGSGSQHLYTRFRDAIDELFNLYTRDVGRERATVNIYIISSLCGGTGSGMIVDIGFLLQEVLGAHRDQATLFGIFTTPLFYRQATQFPLQANTWAAAQELNYFMTTRPENYKPEHREIECISGAAVDNIPLLEKPYDHVYLVDGNLEDGSVLLGEEKMARALTDVLGLLVASRIGDEAASRIADIAVLRNTEAGTVFSSPGVASLVFPANEVISWCAAKGVEELLPLPKQGGDIGAQVKEFLISWEAKDLQASLSRDEQGRSVTPRLSEDPRLRPGTLEELPQKGLYMAVRDRVKAALPELETRALTQMQSSREEKGKEFVSQLDDKIRERIKGQGLANALGFLSCLSSNLEGIVGDVEAGLGQAKERLERAKASLSSSERTFQARVQRAGGLFGRDPTPARDDYLRQAQAQLDCMVDRRTWEEATMLAAVARDAAERKHREVKETIDALKLTEDSLPNALKKSMDTILHMDRVRERPVLLGPVGREEEGLESNLKEIYKKYSRRALDELRRKIHSGGIELLGLSQEELQKRLLEWGDEAFQDIRDISLEDWIDKSGEKSPSQYLSEILRYAAYMWSSESSREKAENVFVEENRVIGLKDTSDSIYTETYVEVASREGTSLVSTGDPHRIAILKMGHGLRLKDFAWLREYLSPYRQQMEEMAPVHVFPEFNLNPERKGKDRRETFARALAYGILKIKRDPLRRRPPETVFSTERGEEVLKLKGKGLFETLWEFVRDDALVAQIEEAIEGKERSVESEELLEESRDFAEGFAAKVPEDDRWLARILQNDVKPRR